MGGLWFVVAALCVTFGILLLWLDRRRARAAPPDPEPAEKAVAGWRGDDALDRTVIAPWGTAPGRAAVWGYLNETLVHGWDLAVATGQPVEADPEMADRVLAAAARIIPEAPRGGHVPFAPVVPSHPDAGPTERLANWSGHTRP